MLFINQLFRVQLDLIFANIIILINVKMIKKVIQ